jgi:hypothetical protein
MPHEGIRLAQATQVGLVVTLPVYGDTKFLGSTSVLLEEATRPIEENFTLLIAEDGSDSTATVDELRWKYHNIVHFQHDQRLGRGKALREAWRKIQADVYVYIDVDLATDLTKFDAYRNLVLLQSQFDLVTGSRYIRGSVTNRPMLRKAASIAYNWLVRLLFRTGVHDHQCGFKSFSRRLVDCLSVEARSDSWFWDTEAIVLAKRRGFRLKEIPVDWVEKKGQRTPVKRLLRDVWLHGKGLLALFYRVYFADLRRTLS